MLTKGKGEHFFYSIFGKMLANIYGIEIYAKIESFEQLKYIPVAWRIPPHYIRLCFHVNGEVIHTGAIASNIDILDALKLKKGNRIRIKYLERNPYIVYISEFKYVYKEANF